MISPWPSGQRARTAFVLSGPSKVRNRRRGRKVQLEFLEDRTLLSSTIPLNSATWTAVGPGGLGSTSSFGGGKGGPVSGRVSGVAGDPTNANVLYAAASGGGVWKSIDAGKDWLPLTDNQATLVMGSIAVSKSNPNVIYAGTGQSDNSGDSFYGRGVLKTTDAGATWTLLGASQFDRKAVVKVAISGTDANTVYVAVATPVVGGIGGNNGIWKTTDGGVTWKNTTASISVDEDYTDVVVDPLNSQRVFAAIGTTFGSTSNGVYSSTDGGTTWAISGNYPAGAGNGRINLAISASNPKEVLASVADSSTFTLKYLQKTTDGGTTWNSLTAVPNYLTAQGDYDNTVAIDPTNENVIFASGIVNYKTGSDLVVETRDGGTTWFDLTTDSAGTEPHTDTHASGFDAAGHYLLGGDGGVWRLDVATQANFSWSSINSNLQTLQFVGNSLDPTNPDVIYGGAQDNGTSKFTDSLRWNQFFGGDGGYTAVDPSNPQTVYLTYIFTNIYRSDDGGKTVQPIQTGINTADPVNFYAPYVLDPLSPSHLLFGTDRLYSTTNKGNSWTAITAPGTNGWTASGVIDRIAIAPSDSQTIYVDTSDGKFLVSTDGGTNWNDRSIAGVDGSYLTQISVSPNDPRTAYVVLDEFNASGHVFKTSDGGANWLNISGNLPNIPTTTVAVDIRPSSSRIYVGTDTGVFASSDGGGTWAPYKLGLPNVQVTTLELNTNLNILMAGTYGRGVFEIRAIDSISVLPVPLSPTEGVPLLASTLIAQFNDSTGILPPNQYTATISWGDGSPVSTGTIVNLNNGFYGVEAGHTYTRFGTYIATITVTSTTGSSGQSKVNEFVQDAPLTPSPITIVSVEGANFSGVVGTITDANPFGLLSDMTATIDWGNGNITNAKIKAVGNGDFAISGANTYPSPGSYPVAIIVNDLGGSTTTIRSTANVADAPLVVTPVTLHSIAGAKISATVASFVDTGPPDLLTSYYANINWGDNSNSSTSDPNTTVSILNRGIRYDVVATHTYAQYGTYNVAVTVGSFVGASATTTPATQAIIADAPLAASSANFTVIQGANYTGLVAGFTSQNTYAVPTDFSGSTINWGDGSALSSAIITANGNGVFGVSGSHTYTTIGNYPVTVQVISGGGSSATAKGFATVIYAALTSSGNVVTGIAGQSITDTIATFVDKYSAAKLANFTAIVDWGDGQVTDGLVTQPGGIGTGFVVTGTHAWAKPQTYPITVSILENGDLRDVANSTAVLADASLSAAGTPLSPIFEGGLFGGTVGTFTTGNLLAGPSDFVSTIDWGDGTTSHGLAAQIGSGVFSVSPASPHTYGAQGVYVVGLNVISLGGTRASAVSSLTVNPAPINPTPGNSIQSVAGQTFNGTIGSFTQFALTPASAFAASIDWGNGDVSAGVVTSGPNGTFVVSGKEIFKQAGQFAVNVTIVNNSGGPTGTMSVPAVVTDAATTAQGSPVSAVVGEGFTAVVSTLTTDNVYSKASEYNATIDWGDGSSSKGTVVGGGGTFNVYGSHVYLSGSSGFPVTVSTIHAKGDGTPGSVTTSVSSARILLPISGTLSPASDSGYSNTDGITNVTQPVFFGKGQPGASVQIYAAATSNPTVSTKVGTAVIDSLGSWAVTISPLADGTYVTTAAMTDSFTGIVVSRIGLMSTPLTIVTAGPTVSGVTLNAPAGLLQVVIQTGLVGLNPNGLTNRANYSLGLPVGTGLQNFTSTALSTAQGANGQVFVNLSYNLGGKKFKPGGYVVTLRAAGLTDLAGNPLVEKNLVTFPQSTNFPNPNYVAQIDVSKSGAASAPHAYVSVAEQIAAGNFSATVQGTKVIRVPKTQVTKLTAGSTPKPTSIKAKSRTH